MNIYCKICLSSTLKNRCITSNVQNSESTFGSELMVQIKQKTVRGVENPLPKSFLGGVSCQMCVWRVSNSFKDAGGKNV